MSEDSRARFNQHQSSLNSLHIELSSANETIEMLKAKSAQTGSNLNDQNVSLSTLRVDLNDIQKELDTISKQLNDTISKVVDIQKNQNQKSKEFDYAFLATLGYRLQNRILG